MPPDAYSAKCPDCHQELWKRKRGEWTLSNRILKLVDGEMRAKCSNCGTDVPVPFLQVSEPKPKSRRRLIVRLDHN